MISSRSRGTSATCTRSSGRCSLLVAQLSPPAPFYSVQPDPAMIAFANTTTIRATCNGRAINAAAPEDLAARLGSERRAVFQIELENNRAQDQAKVAASYTILTAVPEEADLAAVDRLFAQHLAVDAPTVSDVRVFADAAGRYSSADRYTNGLAEYVLAILAKEGQRSCGATLPFEAFQMKMQRALAELVPHQARPFPQAVCATARLNINDVRRGYPTIGNPTLDGILRLLTGSGTTSRSAIDQRPLTTACSHQFARSTATRTRSARLRRPIPSPGRAKTAAFAEYAARA